MQAYWRFQVQPRTMLAILTLCVLALPAAANTPTQTEPPGDAATAAEEAKPAGPKAVVPEPVKNFGKVPRGTQLSYDYEIHNGGTEDLKITRVAPACGCTVASYDEVIQPGESGKIHAEIDTSILGGQNSRTITVYTNDPERPVVRLVYEAELVPILDVHPGYARYRVVHGEEEEGLIKQWVFTADGQDFKVTGVESPVPYLGVTFHKATEEERHDEVSAKVPESPQWVVEMVMDYNNAPLGAIAQEVVIHTDHKVQKNLVIPVSGFVRPPMWATPNEINLGEIEPGQKVRLSVVVQNFLTEPMEITGVRFDGKEVESTVNEVMEGRKYTVWVTVAPGEEQGPVRGKLEIGTSHPKNPVVEVPVRGRIL